MANLPPLKRFVQDDFQGITTISAFCGKLFYPLNLFLNATYAALNNGLTIQANSIGMISQATSITSNSSGIATTTINWAYPQSPPVGVVVMNCTQSSVPTTLPLMSWSYSAGVITVTLQFTQISSGAVVANTAQTYNLTFWVSGG